MRASRSLAQAGASLPSVRDQNTGHLITAETLVIKILNPGILPALAVAICSTDFVLLHASKSSTLYIYSRPFHGFLVIPQVANHRNALESAAETEARLANERALEGRTGLACLMLQVGKFFTSWSHYRQHDWVTTLHNDRLLFVLVAVINVIKFHLLKDMEKMRLRCN